MWLRSLGVIAFIAIVGTTGIYFARRPTIASGDVIAAELVRTNEQVTSMVCDKRIAIGLRGATFHCTVELTNGAVGRLKFVYDRNGVITQAPDDEPLPAAPVEKTADPWAD